MNEYLTLLSKREAKVVLGRKWVNLWLLVIVLIATFISIAFSNGSMSYLNEKMNDPFTNWVNIKKGYGQDKFEELRQALANSEIQQHYGYKDFQSDHYFSINVMGKNHNIRFMECRFFEQLNTEFMDAILSPDNVVAHAAIPTNQLSNATLGFIVTYDNLVKLGYSLDSIPAFLDYSAHSPGSDTLGFRTYEEKYVAAPMPILAVVRRLPENMDLIGSRYFYSQYLNDRTYPFDFNELTYSRNLYYWVDETISNFDDVVKTMAPDSIKHTLIVQRDEPTTMLQSWKTNGSWWVIYSNLTIPEEQRDWHISHDIAEKIAAHWDEINVKRIFKYHCSEYQPTQAPFLSVNFASLDSIRAFENYAKENFNVQIEMSQVNSKENFNAVSVMANILSWAMIVFSMICILMFIVNMLQSYFQKVKRNMGTFKAFGISSSELIGVYVLLLILIVAASIVSALAITWMVQLLLPIFGIMKDGTYNYLSIWSFKTLLAIVIMFIATIITVYQVMSHLLDRTPGDLIYDR